MSDEWNFRWRVPEGPKGKTVEWSAEDAEKHLLKQLEINNADPEEALQQLARFYFRTRPRDEAMSRLRQIASQTDDLETKAACFHLMGCLMERFGDFKAAISLYGQAFALEPSHPKTSYFAANNLGFCLNVLGRYVEGERYCRSAIAIDQHRANGHKNLGIALQGQGRVREAAKSFIRGTHVDAGDERCAGHLEDLLREHPELKSEFESELKRVRQAVEYVAAIDELLTHVAEVPLSKRLLILWLKVSRVIRRLKRR